MPRKPPAEPIDHHYNIPKLNRAFFAAGALLTAVFVWMVIADYKRDWKSIQQTFLRLDRAKTLEAVQTAREKAFGEERDKLRGELVQARNEMRARKHDCKVERPFEGARPEDLPGRPGRQVPEGVLRRGALLLRGRPGQPPEVGAKIAARGREDRETDGRRESAPGATEEGRGGNQSGDPAHHRPARRGADRDREADRRVPPRPAEGREPETGHAL